MGKPPVGPRVTCGDVMESCTPKDTSGQEHLVGKYGRCLYKAQCQAGMYCCPYMKACLPSDGTAMDPKWLKKNDPERYRMVYGKDRPCKNWFCDICEREGQRGGKKAPMGLCSGVFKSVNRTKETKPAFQTIAKPHLNPPLQAYDPSHPLCHCQKKFIQLWKDGLWVKDVSGKGTCPTDPIAGVPPRVDRTEMERVAKKAQTERLAKATTPTAPTDANGTRQIDITPPRRRTYAVTK